MKRFMVALGLAFCAAGCSLTGMFDEPVDSGGPPCVPGETREIETGCGVCATGTLTQRCTDGRAWEDASCEDPLDADGDGYANEACDGLPGGCCTARRDCNDAASDTHRDTFDCIWRDAPDGPDTEACETECRTTGSRRCTAACVWSDCAAENDGCNGVDDDCDGETDEDVACRPGTEVDCETTCGSTGTGTCTETCLIPSGSACAVRAESCNGVDDDCDTITDDGFGCARGATVSCTAACGSLGVGSCSADCVAPTSADCVPPAEICSGVDDDCDTTSDEGFACVRRMQVACTTVCGSTGQGTCTDTCGLPPPDECPPPTEACENDLDDDCDTLTDEVDPGQCTPGMPAACTTICGSSGTGVCTAACVPPAAADCPPPAEACNAEDDDCDGDTDETEACAAGSTVACTTICATTGTGICSEHCEPPAPIDCVPPDEECNGADDDCDRATDEDFACPRGGSVSCTTSCGSTGTGACTSACALPTGSACTAPPEICDGADDDCDTAADEGFPCTAGRAVACTASCGSAGSGTCTAGCTVPFGAGCNPPRETCNGVDDDCTAGCDNGFACCAGTTQACSVCGGTGSQTCSGDCGGWSACTRAEICNSCDDDADTVVDDGYECVPATTRSCTACGETGLQTCGGGCSWGACALPAGAVHCLIGGICYDAGGEDPTNLCRACDPATRRDGWTPRTSGTACEDGLFCNGTDACDAFGTCQHGGDPCTGACETCDAGAGRCAVAADRCAISGTCYNAGFVRPGYPCQACLPATSQTAWSPNPGGSCNDGLYCNGTEACDSGGACLRSSPPCDDGLSCTSDTCSEAMDNCTHVLVAGFCQIASACYADGAGNPANACQVCRTSLTTTAWSARPDFTPCTLVTSPDRAYDICSAGACVSPGCGTAACNAPGTNWPLADTGLRTCFLASGSATCPGTAGATACATTSFCGQDAQYGWDAGHAAGERFARREDVSGQPIVVDNVTGLVWQGCVAGLSGGGCTVGAAAPSEWQPAVDYCEALGWSGASDWRLPSSYELFSIVDFDRAPGPARVDPAVFPATPADWLFSISAFGLPFVFGVHFPTGSLTARADYDPSYVRCVRGGPAPPAYAQRFLGSVPVSGQPVVTDNATGLVWAINAGATNRTWEQALAWCEGLDWAGATDWSLPSLVELRSIARDSSPTSPWDSGAFPDLSGSHYWTATSWNDQGYQVNFGNGFTAENQKTSRTVVRCVRRP